MAITSSTREPAAAADATITPSPLAAPPNGASRTATAPVPASPIGTPMSNGCTAPQLRRFIKSRPYVPMHELRRRFGIYGDDDDVSQV